MNQVIEQILNDEADNLFAENFEQFLTGCSGGWFSENEIKKLMLSCLHRLAEHACKEQREICANEWLCAEEHSEHGAILNAPLASDKYKP